MKTDELWEAQKRVIELEEALRPFGEVRIATMPADPESLRVVTLRLRDLQQAKKVLNNTTPDEEKCPSCDVRMTPKYMGTSLQCEVCNFLWQTV